MESDAARCLNIHRQGLFFNEAKGRVGHSELSGESFYTAPRALKSQKVHVYVHLRNVDATDELHCWMGCRYNGIKHISIFCVEDFYRDAQ